ncbi:hypothetical protein [Alistipes sp.]|uniref:ATP-dependent DNA ligase n=1 Tax=Alistipes sp. TaxID=1872444 RepID=UPI003AF030AB
MTVYDDKLRPLHGYEEGRAEAVDAQTSERALTYKNQFLKRFIPIDQRQIGRRLTGDRFYVTRKYDGEYAMIVHDGSQTVTINRSGRVRRGIPCIAEAGRLLEAAGVGEAMLGAEIYVDRGNRRGRVNDLLAALADPKRIGDLRLAVYDIVSWNGKPWRANYTETWKRLHEVLRAGERVRVVDMEVVTTAEQVAELYEKWVVRERSEGLVVRSDLPFVFKIKPRHSIDAVVIGFSEGIGTERGQVRSLLLALMPAPGRYQVMGRVGSGLIEEVRELLFDRLSQQVIPSDFVETDANLVAFRMVRPEAVVEVTVGDLLYETEAGPKMNPLLEIVNGVYRIAGTVAGAKFIAPVFVRIRTDKRADAGDVRLEQIERFALQEASERIVEAPPPAPLAKSRLLFREVYLKTVGEKTMVQKYMVWKTNKEQSGDFPAYVLYVMNYSPQRMEPFQRDVDVSDSADQIRSLLRRALEKNLKSGWRKVASLTDRAAEEPSAKRVPPGDAAQETVPAQKRASRTRKPAAPHAKSAPKGGAAAPEKGSAPKRRTAVPEENPSPKRTAASEKRAAPKRTRVKVES